MCCCAEFIVKYVLFFANLVFCLAGLALIGIGVAVLVQVKEIVDLLESFNISLNTIPILVIVLGSIVFLIAFFGCCGAIKKSRCLLLSYSICMLILAGLKVAMVVVLFLNLDDITNSIEEWLADAFGRDNLLEAYHLMETAFQCCGTTGANSYLLTLRDIPESCCPAAVTTCTTLLAYDGCNTVIGSFMTSFGNATIGVLIAIVAVEVVAMVFACFLSSASRDKHYV